MSRLVPVLLLLIAVKVALVAARGPAPIVLDAADYWDLSTLVLGGDPWLLQTPIAYRTPLYPWFLAAIRWLTGPHAVPAIVAAQAALYVATAGLAGRLAWRLTGREPAVIVTLLALLPAVSAVTYVTALLTETLFTALLMLNLSAVVAYVQRPTPARAGWAAASFSLALLARPIVLWLWVIHLAYIAARRRAVGSPAVDTGEARLRHRPGLRQGIIAAFVVVVIVAPWIVRNRVLFGDFFLTEFVGRNVWIVTFQDGSGAGLPLPDSEAAEDLAAKIGIGEREIDWRHTWSVARALTASGLDDDEADRLMKQVAVDAIRRHPVTFSEKAVRRVVNFWRTAATDLPEPRSPPIGAAEVAGQPEAGPDRGVGQPTWSWRSPWVEAATEARWSRSVPGNTLIAALVGLAVLMMILHPASRWEGVWIGAMLAYFTLVTGLIEIPDYRYRLVVEPLSAVAVGCGWVAWRDRPSRRDPASRRHDAPSSGQPPSDET